MPISMLMTATSAGYGAVDIATEYVDQTMITGVGAPGTFKNVTDPQRVITTGVGAAIAMLSRKKKMQDIGQALLDASIPLTEKTLVNAVLQLSGSTSTFRARGRGRGQIQIRNPGAFPRAGARGRGMPNATGGVVY